MSENRISLLDILAPIVEGWKFLVMVPLIVGAVAYFITSPKNIGYEASTFVAAEPDSLTFFQSPAFLSSVAAEDVDPTVGWVFVEPTPDLNVSRVFVRQATAEQATARLNSVIQYIETRDMPAELERDDLVHQIAAYDSAIAALTQAQEEVSRSYQTVLSSDRITNAEWGPEAFARAITLITEDIRTKSHGRQTMQQDLTALPTKVILSTSSQTKPIIRNLRIVVPFAVIGALALVILLIVLREAVRRTMRRGGDSENISRIRNAFRLRKPKAA